MGIEQGLAHVQVDQTNDYHKTEILKSSEQNNEKGDRPYHGFRYLSPVSDPLDLTTRYQRQLF